MVLSRLIVFQLGDNDCLWRNIYALTVDHRAIIRNPSGSTFRTMDLMMPVCYSVFIYMLVSLSKVIDVLPKGKKRNDWFILKKNV